VKRPVGEGGDADFVADRVTVAAAVYGERVGWKRHYEFWCSFVLMFTVWGELSNREYLYLVRRLKVSEHGCGAA